jgi:hypothetical protein
VEVMPEISRSILMPEISDEDLRKDLLQLCTDVAHDSAWRSAEFAGERFVQNVVAYKLIKKGFEVTTETSRSYMRRWLHDPIGYVRNFAVDMIIWGRPENGATLVELKKGSWQLQNDVAKLQGLLAGARADVFGFAVACISTETENEFNQQIEHARNLAQKLDLPLIEGQPYDAQMPRDWHHYVSAVGVHLEGLPR